jgi:hypothetical protein
MLMQYLIALERTPTCTEKQNDLLTLSMLKGNLYSCTSKRRRTHACGPAAAFQRLLPRVHVTANWAMSAQREDSTAASCKPEFICIGFGYESPVVILSFKN